MSARAAPLAPNAEPAPARLEHVHLSPLGPSGEAGLHGEASGSGPGRGGNRDRAATGRPQGAEEDGPLDSAIDVITPENIAFEYRVAGPFRRLLAVLIDVAIRAAALLAIVFVGGLLATFAGFAVPEVGELFVGVMTLLWFVVTWFYGGLFETYMNGQTPGKWMLRLRVVTTSGEPINGMQAVMRNLLRYADLFPMLSLEVFLVETPMYAVPTGFLGLAFMSMNRRYQRLGDLVCNTMVILEEPRWLMGVAKLDDPRAVQLASHLPIQVRVSRSLARALSAYVERRRYFSVSRRREIARRLGEPLLEKFGLPRDTSCDLLLCALYYRAFIADRADDDEHAAAIGQANFLGGGVGYQGTGAGGYVPYGAAAPAGGGYSPYGPYAGPVPASARYSPGAFTQGAFPPGQPAGDKAPGGGA